MRTPENVESVRAGIACNPKRFATEHAMAVQISSRSLQRILHQAFHFHHTKFEWPKKCDYTKRADFFIEIFKFRNQEQNFHEHLIMSDEAHFHFHLSGYVSKQKMRY